VARTRLQTRTGKLQLWRDEKNGAGHSAEYDTGLGAKKLNSPADESQS
jgi:hypothetical protein